VVFEARRDWRDQRAPSAPRPILYIDYYHRSRTHLSLDKDCPDARPIQPPNRGAVIAIARVGGLHQRYERLAA